MLAALLSTVVVIAAHRWTYSREAFWIAAFVILAIWVVAVPAAYRWIGTS